METPGERRRLARFHCGCCCCPHRHSMPEEMDVVSGGSSSSSSSSSRCLQVASTACALLGSVSAVAPHALPAGEDGSLATAGLASAGRNADAASPSELAAAALLVVSVALEVVSYRKRRAREAAAATAVRASSCSPPVQDDGGCACSSQQAADVDDAAAATPRRCCSLWWPLFALVVTAALAMGAFTAISICGGAWARMHLGIVPRTWSGLLGIFFGCFVHLSWYHCYWNALALLLLGSCVFQAIVPVPSQCGSETRHEDSSCGDATTSVPAEGLASGKVGTFMAISAFIALSSGFCVWCLARPVLHAGASGVVCGYLGLLLALTLRQRDVPLGALAMVLAVVACYGSAALMTRRAAAAGQPGFPGQSALYEVCVSQSHSTEHHTFGFLSGLAAALFFCRPSAPPRQEPRRVVGAPAEAAS
eukprot:TRINITY_DN66707_c0_g1_i1.p1 TRINITY_DN66707_c0_g1~~TRINITY_DN66707_c0_g1_i1.p1  ORF type:complete len:421 (+),score=67.17 TRINITY_DN66707_c0_g1_i1:95-1357(+)